MATAAPITGAPTRAPSRRQILAGLAAAPALALPVAAGAALATTERVAWDRLIAAHRSAEAVSEHYDATVYRPADLRVERIAPRPEMTFEVPDRSGYSPVYVLRANNLDEWDDNISPQVRNAAAEEKAKWRAYKEARKAAGLDAIEDESERLGDLAYAARWAAINTPAPDLTALRWKLDQLFGQGARDEDDESPAWAPRIVNDLMSDVHRLLPAGRVS